MRCGQFALVMHDAVAQLCQFAGVPALCGAHKVACDALQRVDVV